MTAATTDWLHRSLLYVFTLFVIGSTFSIALAQTTLGISLLLFIIICMRDRYQPFVRELKWVWLFVGLYVFWLLLSSLLGPSPLKSVSIAKEEWLFLVMPITIYLARDDRHRRLLTTAFAVSVGMVSLYAVTQAFTGVAWLKLVHGRFVSVPLLDVQGNFNNSMTFGNFSVTAGCFLLALGLAGDRQADRKRIPFSVAGLLAIVAAALSMRRGAIAAAVVMMLLLAILLRSKTRWLMVGLGGAIVATILLAPGLQWRFGGQAVRDLNTTNPSSRVYIWTRSLDMVKQHPVFGVGQGNFYDEYVARLPLDIPDHRKLTHAHNDFINIAAIAGIPGVIFFAGIWLAVLHFLWHGFRNARFSQNDRALCVAALLGAGAFLITSMIEATFADEEVREMLMFVWAVGLAVAYNGSAKRSQTA